MAREDPLNQVTGWAGVAKVLAPDLSPQQVEAAAPVLDALLQSFRPLTAQLSLLPAE